MGRSARAPRAGSQFLRRGVEQRPDRRLERYGKAINDCDGRIAHPPFDAADISAMEAALLGKLLLRPAFVAAQALKVNGEAVAHVHGPREPRVQPIDLQTMSHIPLDCQAPPSVAPRMDDAAAIAEFRLSTTQQGAIAESIVAIELMTGSGGRLAPFKPIADDDGIDLLVYDKETSRATPLQVKARFNIDAGGTVEFNVRKSTWRKDPAARLLCVLIADRRIAAAWLVPMHELETAARLKGDKFVLTPSPKDTSKDRYAAYRVRDVAAAVIYASAGGAPERAPVSALPT